MPNVVDLTLTAEARRALHRVLDQRGIGFFLKRRRREPPRLDPRRIAWVVEARRRGGPDAPAAIPTPCRARAGWCAASSSGGWPSRYVEAGL